ncbi:MAG: hypothetical protein U9P50_03225 [Patescibacteria group bacterium]|nr:hypothetical protein [Patescibacteria group bacterium]
MKKINNKKKQVGIGCFHIKLDEQGPGSYLKKLKEVLEAIPSINNIEISDSGFYKGGFLPINENIEDNVETFDSGTGFYPSFSNAKVSFDVFIPQRIQKKISPFNLYCESENFKVAIYYTHIFTFTVVEPTKSIAEGEGSVSVVVIREFLKNEFDKCEEEIELETLGPSPMHIDYELELKNKKFIQDNSDIFTTNLGIKITKKKSYDLFRLYGDEEKITSLKNLKSILVRELEDELSLYYLVMLSNTYELRLWDEIEDLMTNIRKAFGNKWWSIETKKYFVGKKIEKLFIKLSFFKQYRISFKYLVKEKEKNILLNRESVILKEYIDNELLDINDDVIEDSFGLVNFFDRKYSNYINNFYLVYSVILGGIIGYFINLLIKTST